MSGQAKGSAGGGSSGGGQPSEGEYDIIASRNLPHPSGVFASICQLIKGALGAGILGSPFAYKSSGYLTGLILNFLMGAYMCYNLHIMVQAAQKLYKKLHVPSMSYPDLGEAAMKNHSNPKVSKWSRLYRYWIDFCICLDLFGSCTCYQIMVATTVKQLVENEQNTSLVGKPGFPHVRVYLLALLPFFIAISLLRHIQWLAPFSIVGNIFVLICVIGTIYYSMQVNPTFLNLVPARDFVGTISMIGLIVFSMSCAGIVLPVENNMKQPLKFPFALLCGMSAIVLAVMVTAFFGYAGWTDSVRAPVTLCFPMTTFPKILKALIAINVFATHGINFYAPFQLIFHYLKKLHPPEKEVRVDYMYRGIICVLVTMLGVVFPDVPKLMSFLGCFCLSNMAFIWPVLIQLLVDWDDPGLGPYKWRLIRSIVLMLAGLFLFIAGTYVSVEDLVSLFGKDPEKKHDDIFFYYAYMPPAPAEEE